MMSELVKHAFTTAIGVLVTFYVTSAMKEDDFEENQIKKARQVTESLEKTNIILSSYISRYDSLHEKYIRLKETKGRGYQNDEGTTYKPASYPIAASQKKAANLIADSDWITPDGTILWQFTRDRVAMKGIGNFDGFVEAAGRYAVSGDNLKGTATYSRLLYLPVSENLEFSFKLDAEGNILYGQITDNEGNVTVATLYKKK
jgi:hypothetical protein